MGGVEGHFLRMFQELGKLAGVSNVKCHRFRDTYITDKVRDATQLLRTRNVNARGPTVGVCRAGHSRNQARSSELAIELEVEFNTCRRKDFQKPRK
jgi:integrase